MNNTAKTEVLLCALLRAGKPLTAAELTDAAVALMQAAGWPRRSWSTMDPQVVAALMRGACSRGEVAKGDAIRENSRMTPTWKPARRGGSDGWDPRAPLPPAPDPEGEDHPLHGTTRRQSYVLFDVLDHQLQVLVRQRGEVNDLLQRHNRELGELVGRAKAQLLAAGLIAEGVL